MEPYNSDIVLQILLIAGTSSIAPLPSCFNSPAYGPLAGLVNLAWRVAKARGANKIRYSHITGTALQRVSITVKKLMERRKSAGIRNKSYFEVPQRLHAGDLTYAMLVGLVEGDG